MLTEAMEVTVVEAAARAMGYTPAGILRLVGALEDELGVSLLERSSQGVHLTRAGEELLPDLREISVLMDRTRRRAHTIASPYEGTVSLGCARSVAGSWLAPVVVPICGVEPFVFGIAHRGWETLSAPAAALVRELEAHRAPELA